MNGIWPEFVGFGVAAVDDVFVSEKYPEANAKYRLLSANRMGGGQTATAFVAAARLGASCWYGGKLGENELANFVREIFRREGIAVTGTPAPPDAGPTYAVIIVEAGTGQRSILWTSDHVSPPVLGPEEKEAVRNAACLIVDQNFPGEQLVAARIARESGVPVVGDFERPVPGAGEELLKLVDHLILPVGMARSYLGVSDPGEAVRLLAARDARFLACVTDSEKGCWYSLGSAPGSVRHCPAFKVEPVADTTGCGDVFHGAYAASLIQGFSPDNCIRRAAAAAALKVRKMGGQAAIPTRNELEAFLADNS